jgi:hypothetical protein
VTGPPPYAWALFESGGTGRIPDLCCGRCGSVASTVVTMDADIPEASCRCESCDAEWRLLMTHLQALRLLVDPDVGDSLTWSAGGEASAWTRGIAAAWALRQLDTHHRTGDVHHDHADS